MALRLPPLNTLRLFEAASRHLSFKLAAQELEVTPSAVSHGIQTLEDWLGTPLFVRGSRGLSLTDAGDIYAPAVRQALSLLATASEGVPGKRPREHVQLSVVPTFASRLLLPRLQKFRANHPGISVFLDTTHQAVEFPRDGADVAIRMGQGDWPGLECQLLLHEELVPVCSPGLKAQLGSSTNLCDAPLIHVTTISQDWRAWLEAAGQEPIDCQRGLRVDTIQMATEAAVQGLGIAIGRRPLIEPELEAGQLVAFCGPTVPSQTSYWLVAPPETMRRPEIAALRIWLLEEMDSVKSGRLREAAIAAK